MMKRIPDTAIWVCQKCGTEFKAGSCGGGVFKFCPKCGKPEEKKEKAK